MRKKEKSAVRREYDKQRKRVRDFIRRAEKRGYYFDEGILPPIPKRVTRASVRRLEQLTPDALYKKSIWVDIETGEFISGRRRREQERSEVSKRAAETRKANKASAAEFFGASEAEYSEKSQTEEYYPNLYENTFDMVYETFISKISQPIGDVYYAAGSGKRKYRFEQLRDAAQQAQSEILNLTNQLVQTAGKEELGKRLADNWDRVEMYINYILYGSDQSRISQSAVYLMQILNGGTLSNQQNADITEETET